MTSKRLSFGLSSTRKSKGRRAGLLARSWRAVSIAALVVLALTCVATVTVVGFAFLEKYVERAVPLSQSIASVELVGVPSWLSQQLKAKVFAAVTNSGADLRLDRYPARSLRDRLIREVAWLDDVNVQVKHDRVSLRGRWRKPLALVKRGLRKFYVDRDLVVLDFVPVPGLPIVDVTGLSALPKAPSTGEIWKRDDLAAAVAVLGRLAAMDNLVTPDKPLLDEIKRIDVSNHDGRESSRAPHIVLYTKDDTEIIWGAEYGKWQQHLESTDTQKIAKLYQHYKENGTLLNRARFVNLRDPQDDIPLPIDKY